MALRCGYAGRGMTRGTTTPLFAVRRRATSGRSCAEHQALDAAGSGRLGEQEALAELAAHVAAAAPAGRAPRCPRRRSSAREFGRGRRSRGRRPTRPDRRPSGPTKSRAILRMSTAEAAQVAERRVAGAEVVDRPSATPEPAQFVEAGERRLRVAEHRRLGHLQHERARGEPGRRSRISARSATKSGCLSWRSGQVDASAAAARGPARGCPAGHLAAGVLEQHPSPERDDAAASPRRG